MALIYTNLICYYGKVKNPFILEGDDCVVVQIQEKVRQAAPAVKYIAKATNDNKPYMLVSFCTHLVNLSD